MTRNVVLRLPWLVLLACALLFVAPWGVVGWVEAHYDPSVREKLLVGQLAARDSTRQLDSLRLVYLEGEYVIWRARAEEACAMIPRAFANFEDCRLAIDNRLGRRR